MRALPIRLLIVTLLQGLSPASAGQAGRPHEQAASWRTSVTSARTPANSVDRAADGSWATRITTHALRPAPNPAGTELRPAEGLASYYWQGKQTASGELFDPAALTAAHKTLAFGTRVRVTHLGNGRSVLVRINDRGPFKPGRIIDLSNAAADALGMRGQGLARVKVEVAK